MILRRIIEHVRAQNWTAIAIDFFIVVFGVFIGIQLGNWNEARQERAEQRQVEVRLREDFRLLDERLTDALDFHEETILALNTLRTAIERGAARDDEDEAIRIAVIRGLSYPSFVRKSATYSELLASGRLNLIRDDALRTALAIYNEDIDNSTFNIEQIRAPVTSNLFTLIDHATLTPVAPGDVGLQSVTRYDIAAMARDREFRRRLDAIIVLQTWIYENLARQRRSIDAVLEAMGEEP